MQEELILVQSEGTAHHGSEGMTARCKVLGSIVAVRKQKKIDIFSGHFPPSSPLFIQYMTPAHGIVAHSFQLGPPSAVSPLCKCLF